MYVAQIQLQQELEDLFAALDKAKGTATGIVVKDELRIALRALWKVGEPSGKTAERFDEVMQARCRPARCRPGQPRASPCELNWG